MGWVRSCVQIMDGKQAGPARSDETYAFVESLGRTAGAGSFLDERLSSWEAEQVIARVKGPLS